MLIETLRVFRDVVASGSFSKAAELNFITQSAVSQQVKNLERTLGTTLIGRSPHQLRLTPAGLIFHTAAKRILDAHDEMIQQLKSVSREGAGTLRITAIYSVGTYTLNTYLSEFLREHPEVKVAIEYQKSNRIQDDILRRRTDLAIMAYPCRRPGLEVHPLQTEEMVLVCPPGHPFAGKDCLTLRDLAGEDFIAFERTTPTRVALDKLLRGARIAVRAKMELDNIEAIKGAVHAGAGVSIVPEPTVRAEVSSGALRALRFSDVEITRPLGVLVKKGRKVGPLIGLFLKHLERVRGLP
ncbi:MAG: hypothetical protein A2X36_01005 [Elusimicrobia bacterium GWA2_69_24]|nr:MAG: hypothetical protein A2X36_01005 [Elusimicrobia bacterium GWA2_69_24]